jgi:AraC-like DNA-binding protein
MERQLTRENTWPIFRMLTEMAKGNFSFKISRSDHKDLLEALYEQLNMTAQELRENFKHLAYINPQLSYRFLTNTIIILNDQESIIAYIADQDYTNGKFRGIKGKSFRDFLSESSVKIWEKTIRKISNGSTTESQYCHLEFKLGQELMMSYECYVGMIQPGSSNYHIGVSFFQNRIPQDAIKNYTVKSSLSKWDIIALQEVHDYLSKNVDQPKPNNKDLARKFKLNQYRLKKGFLELFGYTPLQYYNVLRLEEARTRIMNTYQTLELIASDLNFKSYPHFSQAFKRKFGHPPSYFRS